MGKTVKKFMEGNDAMVAGAIAAGARFYAGYPISPSSEVAKGAAKAAKAAKKEAQAAFKEARTAKAAAKTKGRKA